MADVDVSFFFLKIDVDESIQQLETPRRVAGPLAELERKLKAFGVLECALKWIRVLDSVILDRIGGENLQRLTRIATAAIEADRHGGVQL